MEWNQMLPDYLFQLVLFSLLDCQTKLFVACCEEMLNELFQDLASGHPMVGLIGDRFNSGTCVVVASLTSRHVCLADFWQKPF